MKYDIFISYSRKDFKVVSKIAQKVSDAGYSVWMDVDGIESGDEFKSKIAFAIKNSKLFLFFSSLASNKSEWTVKEVNYAIKKKIPIIPIRLDNADYNDSVDFDLAGLDFIQYDDTLGIDFVIQKLMRSLEKKVKPSIKKNVSVNKETLLSSCTVTLDKGGVNKDVKVTGGNNVAKNIGKIVLAVLVIVVFGCIVFALGNNTSKQRDESHVLDSLAIVKRQFEDSIAKIKYEQFRKDSITEQTRLENERKQKEAERVAAENKRKETERIAAENKRKEAERIAAENKRKETERIAAEKRKQQQLQATIINGHEYVDLGLSVKWATCNVGATKPEEYGGYYAWGETEEKEDYSWSTYKWCNGSETPMTKYCTNNSYGTVDNKTTLDLEDDVAHVKWGGSWRMPTKAELNELLNNCTWTWTTQNDVNGYKVTGPNGNSIFLPAAGFRLGSNLYYSGSFGHFGHFWSGSLYESDSYNAYRLLFSSGDYGVYNYYRFLGFTVRPVSE